VHAYAGGFESTTTTTTKRRHDNDDDDVVDDVHDYYYDAAWGLHEDPLVGFWPPTLQSPAGNDISRDSVEGAPARRVTPSVADRAPRRTVPLFRDTPNIAPPASVRTSRPSPLKNRRPSNLTCQLRYARSIYRERQEVSATIVRPEENRRFYIADIKPRVAVIHRF